ncbi:hypothetical protein OHT61_17455 [Streptomyces sp. NBC_00178]|uniref:hypothetical protein n=1 Tax=Streptomyces sp. NBC_00178 TaxID=2975672 RepID=UPI002E2B8BBF|nr:hypothetical protein [Streptomyces sp. NBC_00178]
MTTSEAGKYRLRGIPTRADRESWESGANQDFAGRDVTLPQSRDPAASGRRGPVRSAPPRRT